jgi:hypothetical protein
VGRKFDVDEMNVRLWSNEKQKLQGVFEMKCSLCGMKCKYPRVKAEVCQCIMNTWKNRFAVSMEVLQFEGCRLATKHSISVSEFKVCFGWVRHFMARHDFIIRCQVTIVQIAYEE